MSDLRDLMPRREYPFGWAYRWTNAGGNPMVTVPLEKFDMDEWVSLFASRDELAVEYASCLRDFPPEWDRWPDFNAAILRRWSPAGLRYIKEKAWAM